MKKQVSFNQLSIVFFCTALLIIFFYLAARAPSFFDLPLRVESFLKHESSYVPNASSTSPLIDARHLKELEDENNSLRALLKFYKAESVQHVESTIISHDPLNPTLVYIDKGSNAGIGSGQAVIIGEGFLVGKIIKTTPSRSAVELITNSASRTAVASLGSTETKGIVRGYLDSSLKMNYLREKSGVTVGDTIVTSGLEGQIPPGLIVGSIQQITPSDDNLFLDASVQPAIDLSQLTIVSVILSL